MGNEVYWFCMIPQTQTEIVARKQFVVIVLCVPEQIEFLIADKCETDHISGIEVIEILEVLELDSE